jgi:hypothetical protein
MSDEAILDYLKRRWRTVMNITTVDQAQAALALPASAPQRIRVYKAMQAKPALGRGLQRYGVNAVTVTLTQEEKLIARRMAAGSSFSDAADAVGLDSAGGKAAARLLRAVGFLQRGRVTADLGPFHEGVGLQAHTVRVEGEPAFNVP